MMVYPIRLVGLCRLCPGAGGSRVPCTDASRTGPSQPPAVRPLCCCPMVFCSAPCVSPSPARWWDPLASTGYAEVQRHRLQSSASLTSLMVTGVRSGVRNDPHADFPYRIIKLADPQVCPVHLSCSLLRLHQRKALRW